MTSPLILAIDQGGQSSRVGVYSVQGELLHCFSAACETTHEWVNGVEHIEQNPLDILHGIQDCLSQVHRVLGKDIARIVAAGFAGQGSSLLCWDKNTGAALSPVLSWQDIRGNSYLKNISLDHTQAQLLTGLRLSPHYGASKIKWCLEHGAPVQAAQRNNSLVIGPIVSYIFWHLCGEFAVDPGHAQRTLLWNLQQNDWDEDLLKQFSIPRNILPDCKFHNSYFGSLTIADFKIPFSASARDQGASLFARGMPNHNACYVNIGTGAFIQRVNDSLTAPDGLLVSPLWIPQSLAEHNAIQVSSPVCYANEFNSAQSNALYAWEATVNGAASAISFIEKETGLIVAPELINHVLTLVPEQNCYFLNAVGGLSAPYWRTDLQSKFSEHLSSEQKVLAWLESIIFQISLNLKLMDPHRSLRNIFISGGISRADAICQRLADLIGVPVMRSENTDATLQGIACLAAGMPSMWQPSTMQDVFQPQANPSLLRRYELWHNALKGWLSS